MFIQTYISKYFACLSNISGQFLSTKRSSIDLICKQLEVRDHWRSSVVEYEDKEKKLKDILDFYVHFEAIHSFADGDDRGARYILLKCHDCML